MKRALRARPPRRYFEIYNPTGSAVALSEYAFGTVSNAPNTAGVHEYWNLFASDATIAPVPPRAPRTGTRPVSTR